MTLKEQFEKETGLTWISGSEIEYEYTEWLVRLIKDDLVNDIWYLTQCVKKNLHPLDNEIEQYEYKCKRLAGKL